MRQVFTKMVRVTGVQPRQTESSVDQKLAGPELRICIRMSIPKFLLTGFLEQQEDKNVWEGIKDCGPENDLQTVISTSYQRFTTV